MPTGNIEASLYPTKTIIRLKKALPTTLPSGIELSDADKEAIVKHILDNQ